MSSKFPINTYSYYPNSIDTPDINPVMVNRQDYVDYVMGIHFNALKDCVLTIQKTLGVSPEGIHGTVTDRLNSIPALSLSDYDTRYGGTNWSTYLTKPTIITHKHNGVDNPSKIDLTTDVVGLLPAANIKLSGVGGLTANEILVDGTTTIKTALDGKMNTNGGDVNGSLNVTGNISAGGKINHISHFDATIDDMTVIAGSASKVPLADAWTGNAAKNASKSQTAPGTVKTLCEASCTNLRYNQYVAIFRIKMDGVIPDISTLEGNRDAIHVSAIETTTQSASFKLGQLSQGWISICLQFEHKPCTNNTIVFRASYNTTVPMDIYCDGITVTPVHTTVWG